MKNDDFYTAINLVNDIIRLGGEKRRLVFDNDQSGFVYIAKYNNLEFGFDSISQLCDKLRLNVEVLELTK